MSYTVAIEVGPIVRWRLDFFERFIIKEQVGLVIVGGCRTVFVTRVCIDIERNEKWSVQAF